MTALVVVMAVVVGLLTILVVALLRSHAEILATLHELGAGVHDDDRIETREGVPQPRPAAAADARVSDFVGRAPGGGVVNVGIEGTDHNTLLAFLSSTCLTCRGFWEAFADPEQRELAGGNTRIVVVTKSADAESPATIASLATEDVTVVMSSEAWLRYEVEVAPYFLLVEARSGAVVGEGAASSWDQVRSLLGQAEADGAHGLRHRSGQARSDDSDEALRRAGIEPNDLRLYPSRESEAR